MDFKQRHPGITHWPFWVLERQRRIFPYKSLLLAELCEVTSHDGLSTFLLFHGGVSEEGNYWRTYAVEAPREWSVRESFENGDITWSEFFKHRGWILELTGELDRNSDVHCRYIEFSEMTSEAKESIADLDAKGSPYQMLHDYLLEWWAFRIECGRDPSEFKERYESLIKNHGHRLSCKVDKMTKVNVA